MKYSSTVKFTLPPYLLYFNSTDAASCKGWNCGFTTLRLEKAVARDPYVETPKSYGKVGIP